MESTARQMAKSLTWQLLGLVGTAAIAYSFTGSLREAGGLAASSAALATVTYVLHEKAWNRVAWGRRAPAPPDNRDQIEPASTM